MKKQKLIEKINKIAIETPFPKSKIVDHLEVIKLIKQLDEPEKVKVPQFVADWYEYFKKTGDWDLFQAMDYLFGKKEIREWLEDKNNQETFARAWLDGCEVEEEKRYLVKIKASGQYIMNNPDENAVFFYSSRAYSKLTRKELEEAGFGWVFDCEGIEIEEVEYDTNA